MMALALVHALAFLSICRCRDYVPAAADEIELALEARPLCESS